MRASFWPQGKTVKIICVGKKGYDSLRREFADADRRAGGPSRSQACRLHRMLMPSAARSSACLTSGEFDVCTLFYSEFKSVISARSRRPSRSSRPLPAEAAPQGGASALYEYEPDAGAILEDLIPRNISVQIFRALLENVAGEMGAKMSAMDNATRNAGEMINKLTLSYNRQRQAQITKELIEIISGAEAL